MRSRAASDARRSPPVAVAGFTAVFAVLLLNYVRSRKVGVAVAAG